MFKLRIALGEVDANTMVWLCWRWIFAIIACGDDKVRPVVAIEAGQFKRGVAQKWVPLKDDFWSEDSLAVVAISMLRQVLAVVIEFS